MQTLTMVLGDTQSDIEKKTKYYTNLKDTFNFEEEMKDFLSEKSTRLLESCIKLQNMTYATQRKLQDNYPNGQKLEIGSVYRCHNLIGFYYYLLIAYSTKNLELPIYALKNSENGVYTSGCSKKEYVFQNWVKYERKNHVIFASHIHKNGGKKFGRLYPDLYDSSALEIIAYNGCFFHGHLGTVSTPINSTLKEWPSSKRAKFDQKQQFLGGFLSLARSVAQVATKTSLGVEVAFIGASTVNILDQILSVQVCLKISRLP